MNSNGQKGAVLALRQQGCSYPEIAKQMDLSPNTVKSICRRSGVKMPQPKTPMVDICKNCGEPLPPNASGRKRTFCSDKCRYSWWNAVRRKKPYRLTCLYCGKQFISYGNRKRKFCGRECYIQSCYGEGLP